MPFKSEKQRKWMWANDPEMAKKWEKEEKMKKETKVRQLIKKMVRETMDEDFAGSYPSHIRKKFDGKRRKQSEVLGYKLTGKNDIKTEIDDATVHERPKPIKETAKRDYKAEYKKFQSSTKAKKYRAELNKYNRQKGTYGNGDGKDASHKGGKIAGFEKESVNRGRAEKSRLKKEGKLTEKSAISLNLWVKEFERLAKKNKMNPVDFVKKHIEKRKGMDNEVVKNVLKHFQKNEGKLKEGKFSKEQLNLLKLGYGSLNKLDPSSPTYKKFIKFLEKLPKDQLKQLANADIKFVSMLAKNRIKEGKLTEAISGSDRKVMMMIVREILENLKKVSKSIKPSNAIGSGVLSILRAMTYSKDNANYKNYKKYFPKTFNSKLTQKRVKQFHSQTDKVQLTMVKQAMNKVLGEGKLTEISNKVIQNLKDTSGKMWDYYYQEKPAYVQPFNEPRGEKIKVKDIKDKKLKVKIKQLDKILRERKLTEKKESAIDVVKRIVKNHQHEKGVDVQTANLILRIHSAYDKNPALQKKFEKMPLKKMAQGVWRFVK